MTDVALARAELTEALKHVKTAGAFAETAARAAGNAASETIAAEVRIANAMAALESEPPPVGLPKASLLDAADTLPGGTMVFRLELDNASTEAITFGVNVSGTEPITLSLAAGMTALDIPVEIPGDAAPGIWSATISGADPTEIEIADGEAIGKVVAAAPPSNGDLPASGENVAAPIIFPAGEWRELRTFAAVVELDTAPTTHVKVAGGDSTQNAFGGWVLERHSGGQMQAWVYVGGTVKTARSTGQLPIGKAVFVAARIFPDKIVLTMGSQSFSTFFTGSHDALDGPAVVGDGFWKHELAGAWPGEILAWQAEPTALSDAELAALADEWADLLGAPGNGGNGGNGNGGNGGNGGGNPVRPIEPTNSSLHQVTLTVASDAPTHVWEGAGTGLNTEEGARAVFERVKQHRAKLDRIGMDVLRIFSPQTRDKCVGGYKPYFDLFRPRLVVASGFVYRSGGPVRNNIKALAEGTKYCIDHGLRIDIVTLQNEPDGNPANKPRDGGIADHQRWLRQDLDSLGLQRVKIAALEWRHPPNGGIPEFDVLKAAGLIGKGKAVELGCGHVYDKVQGFDLAERLRSVGATWSSWETGNNGSGCSSVARALSAANLGSAFDCLHYVMVTTATPNSEQMGQAFLDFNGNPRPWTPHWEVAFGKALVPESTIYRCSSNDRAPGMPTTMDQWMVRNAAVSGGRNPRLNVVIAKRKDGKTAITATNTTHGTDAFSPYTGGHYGNLNQQHSLRVPWLSGKDGSFQIWRASPEGAVSGPQVVGMDDGLVRWSIHGGESVGLVGGAA